MTMDDDVRLVNAMQTASVARRAKRMNAPSVELASCLSAANARPDELLGEIVIERMACAFPAHARAVLEGDDYTLFHGEARQGHARALTRAKRHALRAPVCQLGDPQFVFAPAVDGVGHAEFLRQLPRPPEPADDLSIELQLVDLAVVERLGIVRVRAVEILMRAGRDADRVRRADTGDLRFHVAVAVEDLDALVAGIRDVDVPLRVERDAVQHVELSRLGAALSPRLDEVAVLVEFRDARVAVG